ncbi:MAG TPA: hypothetical protein VFX79_00320 [Candidatus Saccharimonadales bacterium]|nr:hypothetical protein [Candidatus Saccharimonadales bacterium]
MSNRGGFRPEDSESFADYREMIRVTSNVADERTESASRNIGLGIGAGVGSIILGVEVSPIIGAIGAAPTAYLTQNGIRGVIEAIRAGNQSSTLQSLHHHEMYERRLAEEQAQVEGFEQPE